MYMHTCTHKSMCTEWLFIVYCYILVRFSNKQHYHSLQDKETEGGCSYDRGSIVVPQSLCCRHIDGPTKEFQLWLSLNQICNFLKQKPEHVAIRSKKEVNLYTFFICVLFLLTTKSLKYMQYTITRYTVNDCMPVNCSVR